MFKLAYAAAEVFNLLGYVCDCGSFLFFSQRKIEFIKKGSEYCVRVFVCNDTLLFSISSKATDDPFQEDSDSSRAWTMISRMRRSDELFFFPHKRVIDLYLAINSIPI